MNVLVEQAEKVRKDTVSKNNANETQKQVNANRRNF